MYVQGKIKLLLLLSATNVSQFAQLKKHHGQQCVRNNVSSFTRAFTLNELNCSCFCHIIDILLTESVGLYGRILTSVVCTDLTAFGLYL